MNQANDNDTGNLRSRKGVNRRSMLALIVGGAAIGSGVASDFVEARAPSAIATHFAVWERLRRRLRCTERSLDTALSNFQTIAPTWPDLLKYEERASDWRSYCRRADTVTRLNGHGDNTRYLGSKAIAHALDRLQRIADDNSPIFAEARERYLLAKQIEDAEDAAASLSGCDAFQRDFDAESTTVGDICDVILAIDATCVDDLCMQARVLRDSDRGMPKDATTMRFLNSIITSRFGD